MEFMEGGPVTDMLLYLQKRGRRLYEEHIAYIMREVIVVIFVPSSRKPSQEDERTLSFKGIVGRYYFQPPIISRCTLLIVVPTVVIADFEGSCIDA